LSRIIILNGLTKLHDHDLKLYTSLISTDVSHNLQDVLSNLLVWSKDRQLEVNVSKSHVLHLHKKIHSWITILMAISLSRVTWLMILVLTSTYIALNFVKHIDRIVAKAYSRIGLEALYLVTCLCSGKRILLKLDHFWNMHRLYGLLIY